MSIEVKIQTKLRFVNLWNEGKQYRIFGLFSRERDANTGEARSPWALMYKNDRPIYLKNAGPLGRDIVPWRKYLS